MTLEFLLTLSLTIVAVLLLIRFVAWLTRPRRGGRWDYGGDGGSSPGDSGGYDSGSAISSGKKHEDGGDHHDSGWSDGDSGGGDGGGGGD